MPISGQPTRAARSMTLQIFSPMTSPSEPPKTVKSWLKTQTWRPSIVPWPVITASASGRFAAMPKSVVRWRTKRVELLEGARVEQLLDPLARGVPALGVLLLDRRALGVRRLAAKLVELGELLRVAVAGVLGHGADPKDSRRRSALAENGRWRGAADLVEHVAEGAQRPIRRGALPSGSGRRWRAARRARSAVGDQPAAQSPSARRAARAPRAAARHGSRARRSAARLCRSRCRELDLAAAARSPMRSVDSGSSG